MSFMSEFTRRMKIEEAMNNAINIVHTKDKYQPLVDLIILTYEQFTWYNLEVFMLLDDARNDHLYKDKILKVSSIIEDSVEDIKRYFVNVIFKKTKGKYDKEFISKFYRLLTDNVCEKYNLYDGYVRSCDIYNASGCEIDLDTLIVSYTDDEPEIKMNEFVKELYVKKTELFKHIDDLQFV